MLSRTDEILKTTDHLLSVWDAWRTNDASPDQPTAEFEAAIESLIVVCDGGDVPAQCRELCLAVSRLKLEWGYYVNGIAGKRTPNHCPVPAFWGAFESMLKARSGATLQDPKQPEPIHQLLSEKVGIPQICFHIWGHRGQGPFVLPNGQPDLVKLYEERDTPGKHTKGWVHPEQISAVEQQRRQLETRLAATRQIQDSDVPTPDPATVEELLREGQYPDVIARVKNVTVADVLATARRLNITPNERPNLAATRSDKELPTTPPELDDGRPLPVATPAEADETEDDDEEPQHDDADIEEQVAKLHDGTLAPLDIVNKLKEIGIVVSRQKVQAVIKSLSKRAATPA